MVGEFRQRVVAHILDFGTEHDAIDLEADVLAYLAGDDVVIAGENLDLTRRLGELRDSLGGAFLRGIEEGDIAEQRQAALVGDGIDGLLQRHLLVRDGDDPETIGVEFGCFAFGDFEVRWVETSRTRFRFVMSGDRKYLLDRALADQKTPLVLAARPAPTVAGG